jgi:hypothetical protein
MESIYRRINIDIDNCVYPGPGPAGPVYRQSRTRHRVLPRRTYIDQVSHYSQTYKLQSIKQLSSRVSFVQFVPLLEYCNSLSSESRATGDDHRYAASHQLLHDPN